MYGTILGTFKTWITAYVNKVGTRLGKLQRSQLVRNLVRHKTQKQTRSSSFSMEVSEPPYLDEFIQREFLQ